MSAFGGKADLAAAHADTETDPKGTSTTLRDFARKAPSAPSGTLLARAPHSITSSAAASSVGGTVRPSAFAILRLMTSSNFVGSSTGRSDDFAPLRILST